MTFRLKRQKFHFEVIVADCETDGLLGLESLGKFGGCIDLSFGKLTLSGREFPTHRKEQEHCFRVAFEATCVVPAGLCMVLEARPQGKVSSGSWLVEPLPKGLNGSLAMAKSLVAGGRETVPMEVMTPTSQDVLVHKGTHARMVQSVSLVGEVSPTATCNPPTTKMTILPVNEVSGVRLDDELETLC